MPGSWPIGGRDSWRRRRTSLGSERQTSSVNASSRAIISAVEAAMSWASRR